MEEPVVVGVYSHVWAHIIQPLFSGIQQHAAIELK
jgi:hypothetical protein